MRVARRPARPEPQTPVPRRGGRQAGRRTQGARSEDASERDGACGVARAPRPNDAATGERRPRRRSAASGSPPAGTPPVLTGPGRTPGRVAVPPTIPGAWQGRLAPPALRWRSRRAFWFGTQRRHPARGQGPGWRSRHHHRPPHRHQKGAPRTPPGRAARPAQRTRERRLYRPFGRDELRQGQLPVGAWGGGVAAASGGSVTTAGHRARGQAGRGPRVPHRAALPRAPPRPARCSVGRLARAKPAPLQAR